MSQDRSRRDDRTDPAGSTMTSVLIIVVMALVVVVGLVLLALRGG
jgi:CHASE3 domain sensor protein